MPMTIRHMPSGLGSRGQDLWRSITTDFELRVDELLILCEACRTTDLIDALEVLVVRDGAVVEGPQGVKASPAAVEVRQQRIVLALLIAALRIPVESPAAEVGRTQRRATRGVYAVHES